MSEPIVTFDHVYKKFSRAQNVGTLRDLIPLTVSRLWRRRQSDPDRLRADQFWAVNDVSFRVGRGETLGIIGPNGSGKSTTLKLLSRILRPDRGSYAVSGRLAALIEVGAGFHPDLTGRENVFLNCSIMGMSRAEVREKFDEIVDFAGVGDMIDAPVKRYSSGMAVRLGFATSVFTHPDVLLVDEVLAVGDMEFRAKCQDRMRAMRAAGVTIILVSHNLGEVRGLCDRTLMLFGGRVELEGPTARVVDHYHRIISEKIAAARQETAPADGDGADADGREPDVRVARLELLDAAGTETETLAAGAPATFRVHYRAGRRVERPRVRIDLFWAVGEARAASFDSHLEGVDLGAVEGSGHVDLRVEQVLMAPNAYLVSAHLADEGATLDSAQRVPFRVTEGVPVPGYFGLPHSWSAGAAAPSPPPAFIGPKRLSN